MTNWHGGKGSSRRTSIVTDDQVEDNWNAIFGKKSEDAVKKESNERRYIKRTKENSVPK